MQITTLTHPLAAHLLTELRDTATDGERYRTISKRLGLLLITEATRTLGLRECEVQTPLERTSGAALDANPLFIPVLRAGLGLLPAAQELFPASPIGFVGVARDEKTAVPQQYLCKTMNPAGRDVFVLDPMLATGGSAIMTAHEICKIGLPRSLHFVHVIAAPEGIARLQHEGFGARYPGMKIGLTIAQIDRQLNAQNFILPGLGDYGDRLNAE